MGHIWESTITVPARKVMVGGNNPAVFHGWGVDGWSVKDYGNQTVGAVCKTHAIVEYEDGTVQLVSVDTIRFIQPAISPGNREDKS